ncbi:MAG: M20/M25/M40 family metallo-hydrolase [Gammaproteobacteria bacterium]|nr:M20/M25/M40 family metallo-hydrolase [Gammaproteobacteria bacterium]
MRANRFDAETMLDGILQWVGEESPSYDRLAVERMLERVEAAFAGLPVRFERIPGKDGFADILKVTFGDATVPGILVLGHVDTVHPVGTVENELPIRREGDRVFGPGILDMKSGLYLAVHALREMLADGTAPTLPVTYLVIPDEEVGSPSSRTCIEEHARRHKYVLVPEPAREGKVVSGRHAFARYNVRVRGRPAHAGADNARGASAINRMASLILELESCSDVSRGLTYSAGIINGGTFVNVVPTQCDAQVLCVAPDESALTEIARRMTDLNGEENGVQVSVESGPVRPLFTPSTGGLAIFEKARELAEDVGVHLEHGQFGGGSDGNFTGALGVPTLDGLGPIGAGPHTHDEHILVSSLSSRCQIFAGLLQQLE